MVGARAELPVCAEGASPQPPKRVAAITSIFEKWKPRPRGEDLPKAIKLIGNKARYETQAFWFFPLSLPASN